MEMQYKKVSQKTSQKSGSPDWSLKREAARGDWNSRWEVEAAGYEWSHHGEVCYGYRLCYCPELNGVTGRPTVLDPSSVDDGGPWLAPLGWDGSESRPTRRVYDPLSFTFLKNPDSERPQQRLHRRFSRLSFDPVAIQEFANRFGLLGERGVLLKGIAHVTYAESFDVWCQEVLLLQRLCHWWDQVRARTPESAEMLLKYFNRKALQGEWLREDALTAELPSKEGVPGRVIKVPHDNLLQAQLHLTVQEPVLESTRQSYAAMGWACPEYWTLTDPAPDVLAVAGFAINELVNQKLAETTRVAVQFDRQAKPEQAFYCVVETLLGAIYKSFISEMLGVFIPERICPWCNEPFTPARIDQEYCKKLHAINASKKKKRISAKALAGQPSK